MKRKIRRVFDALLPLVGMGIIFSSALFGSPGSLQAQVIMLLVGVLVLEAGVWGLTGSILPNERHYPLLRDETDRFLGLVRALNAAAVERDEGEGGAHFEESLAEIRASVDRTAKAAGKGTSVALDAPPTGESTRGPSSPRLPADGRAPTFPPRSSSEAAPRK